VRPSSEGSQLHHPRPCWSEAHPHRLSQVTW